MSGAASSWVTSNQLHPCEVATGFPAGGGAREPLPEVPAEHARKALERAIAEALQRSPCGVSFSGGRDSSAMLALAMTVSRREGLPPPAAITIRCSDAPGSDESTWQEYVVRETGVADWEIVTVDDELDFVGPLAQRTLHRHGLLAPANTYFHVPILRLLRGGTLITGIDGDVLLGGWKWGPDAPRWTGAERLTRSYSVQRAFAALPPRLRGPAAARLLWRPPWTRSDRVARRRFRDFYRDAWDLEPKNWRDRVHWWWQRRYLSLATNALDLLADDVDAVVVNPLLDPSFVAAVANQIDPPLGRTAWMVRLFADVLPDQVITRRGKAYFDEAMWNRHFRHFVAEWDGTGVDPELVDVEGLRREWTKPAPHFASALLLHSAWLARRSPASAAA